MVGWKSHVPRSDANTWDYSTAEAKVEVYLKTFEMSNVHSNEVSSYRNEWAHAIITNNVTTTSDIFTNPHRPSTKFNLLQTQMSLSSPEDTYWKSTRMISILPFHLAVISHAMDVIRCLAQHEVDVTQTDDKGNNDLHTLLNVSSHPVRMNDEHVITMYHSLTMLLSVDKLRSCFYQEDTKGLRPLELAASLGHFRLMNAIFHTPGAYLCKTEVSGFQLLQYFRVTEYGKFDNSNLGNRPGRYLVSALRLIVNLKVNFCEPLLIWAIIKLQMNWWVL